MLVRPWLSAVVVLLAGCSAATDVGDDASSESVQETAVAEPTSSTAGAETTVVGDGDPGGGANADVPEILGEPGVVVWVHDAEPPNLHADDPENSADVTSWLQQGMLEGLFGIDANNAYYPELLAGEPQLEQLNSGTVVITYRLRDGLTWSDGTPLTSNDVAYTHEILVEGCEVENDRSIVDATNVGCEYHLANRFGYELVTDFEVVSETEFKVTMAAFYGGWRGLYGRVFAAHAFGDTARDVNDSLQQWSGPNGILPSSGPLVFDRWEPGAAIHLRTNEQYHGSVSPDAIDTGPPTIAGVELVFVADLAARIDLLLAGDAHIMMTTPEPALEALTGSDGFTVAPSIGGRYEHWSINLLADHLDKPQVRAAIAYAIDKTELVTQIYQPIYGSILPQDGLGNSFWMPNQSAYEDHQATYAGHNTTAAADSLRAAGYVQGSDGRWDHPDDGRLTVEVGTTAGVELRDRQLELLVDQLDRVGIEVVVDSAPGGLFFVEGPFSEAALAASASGGGEGDPDLWGIAQFSWTAGPWPGALSGIYRAGSQSNPYGFSSPEYDVAATECEATVGDGERATCYDALDRFATTLERNENGLFVIPLTQTPSYFGYSFPLQAAGVAPDAVQGGPLVNAGDYRFG